MRKLCCSIVAVVIFYTAASSQVLTPWKGKKAAVVITYDDAIDQQLDNAVPVLDSLELKATFYITGFSVSMQKRMNEWKQLAVNGHELGNHTMYHPCEGGRAGREWVKKDYDLYNYTIPRMVDEIRATNLLLQSMDGKTRRTFAFTCGDTRVNDTSFAGLIQNDFAALRGVKGQMHPLAQVNLTDVDCFVVNHHSAEQMMAWVDQAIRSNSLLVILFHGVGGGNGLDVGISDHSRFLHYLSQKQNEVWVAPMVEVSDYIKTEQASQGVKDNNR